MKTYLFDIILNRASKEYGFYNCINRNYNKNELTNFVKKRIENDDILTIEDIFINFKILCDSKNKQDFINKFIQLIYSFINSEVTNFLNENDALNIFISNLKELRQINYSISDKKPKKINEYIKYLINKEIEPFDFIVYAFEWRYTPQGFTYWSDLDMKYRKFLTAKLFNINYHE